MTIRPETGEVVLDCGACWGDTALFFANQVGERGHVYSFEFMPRNIDIFRTNIELNPQLKQRITLITHPLLDVSGRRVSFTENGPGSQVNADLGANQTPAPTIKTAASITIDDFVVAQRLDRIDFIKMDIEGAELKALRGASNTIRDFKPKLAISIYHSMEDFVQIPAYLSSLGLGYNFYLNHGTIRDRETILMAISSRG